MAIDFMIMPLSRYLSGDFVTPTMTFAWQQGLPYTLLGLAGRRDIPKDTPFGGADAAKNRARFVPMLLEDLEKLPFDLGASLWDEASSAAPTFHRVDPSSYAALLQAAKGSHVAAMFFLPASFDAPFDMPVVFERVAGSAPVALRELEAGDWSEAASSARDTLIAALRDAIRLQLPLIVDL